MLCDSCALGKQQEGSTKHGGWSARVARLGTGLGLSFFATLICNNRLSLENTRSARGHGGSGRGARWGHCALRANWPSGDLALVSK